MFLIVCVGMFFRMLPMAEMASMWHITSQDRRSMTNSGGQYHWVSEFAPREYRKLLSYLVGKFSTK